MTLVNDFRTFNRQILTDMKNYEFEKKNVLDNKRETWKFLLLTHNFSKFIEMNFQLVYLFCFKGCTKKDFISWKSWKFSLQNVATRFEKKNWLLNCVQNASKYKNYIYLKENLRYPMFQSSSAIIIRKRYLYCSQTEWTVIEIQKFIINQFLLVVGQWRFESDISAYEKSFLSIKKLTCAKGACLIWLEYWISCERCVLKVVYLSGCLIIPKLETWTGVSKCKKNDIVVYTITLHKWMVKYILMF